MRKIAAALLITLVVGTSAFGDHVSSIARAQDAPPEVGETVVEHALGAPGLFTPYTCPSGRASTRFDNGGFMAVATGGCNDAGQAAFVGSGVQGLTVTDGEARVEGRTLGGGDRAVLQVAIRSQPGPNFGNVAATLNPTQGTVEISVYANGQAKTLAKRSDLAGQVAVDDWNSLSIRVQGSTMWAFVNDKLMISATDGTWDSGNVSVSVGRAGQANAQDMLEVSGVFRNLRVSALAEGDVARAPTYRDPRQIFTATSVPCTQPTALLDDINLVAPGLDVDPTFAALAGAWEGNWGEGSDNPLPARVYIEKIEGTRATMVTATGNNRGNLAGAGRNVYDIDAEGKIGFGPATRRFSYWLNGDDTLSGTLDTPTFTSKITLHRCPPV